MHIVQEHIETVIPMPVAKAWPTPAAGVVLFQLQAVEEGGQKGSGQCAQETTHELGNEVRRIQGQEQRL